MMNSVHLRQIDLNLLVVLDVLLRERSVTRTAARLAVTPSAVSHALRRLRALFDDELLVRDGRQMRRTARAEGLADSLPRLLAQVTRTLSPPTPFSPSTSTRTFRLAAPDFIAPLLPRLFREVGRHAPSVRVEVAPISPGAVQALADGRHDALIAPSAVDHEGVRGTLLGTWPWAVYGRAGHPAFDDWSLESWAAHPHLQIRTSVLRGQGPVDTASAEMSIRRVVAAVVPHFSMAAPVLAQTDLLLTAPSVIMRATEGAHGLRHRAPPFHLPRMGLSLFRSATMGDEPGVRWFHERIGVAARGLGEAATAATRP